MVVIGVIGCYCLLEQKHVLVYWQKLISTASRNSSSANIRISSSLASPIRSLSLLSTTKMRPEKK